MAGPRTSDLHRSDVRLCKLCGAPRHVLTRGGRAHRYPTMVHGSLHAQTTEVTRKLHRACHCTVSSCASRVLVMHSAAQVHRLGSSSSCTLPMSISCSSCVRGLSAAAAHRRLLRRHHLLHLPCVAVLVRWMRALGSVHQPVVSVLYHSRHCSLSLSLFVSLTHARTRARARADDLARVACRHGA